MRKCANGHLSQCAKDSHGWRTERMCDRLLASPRPAMNERRLATLGGTKGQVCALRDRHAVSLSGVYASAPAALSRRLAGRRAVASLTTVRLYKPRIFSAHARTQGNSSSARASHVSDIKGRVFVVE
ncbi:hypothetical protein Q1695_012120 [Nippostrongylus brasiliensis]|nr:hypothetical protein Q1695_012120 [Nippostrongylus brasiliensis]